MNMSKVKFSGVFPQPAQQSEGELVASKGRTAKVPYLIPILLYGLVQGNI
jgi:hypothetical protein